MAMKWITRAAIQLFFVTMIFQVPLFRVPCRTGVCSTPLSVMVGQLRASEIVPSPIIKVLLFPGAFVHNVYEGASLPSWSSILDQYNLTDLEPPSAEYTSRLEVIAGSYFVVGGAIVALVKPGRMSLFGVLLLIWGLIKHGLFKSSESTDTAVNRAHGEPALFFALILALLSIRYDMQKVQRLARPISKPLKSSSKSSIKAKQT